MNQLGQKTLVFAFAAILPFSTASLANADEPSHSVVSQASQIPQMQPLDDVAKARSTFDQLTTEGYTSQDFSQGGKSYTRFQLEESVYLTLPNFNTSSPGENGSVEVYPVEEEFTTYSPHFNPYNVPYEYRISPKVQRIILASGIGAAAGAIGGIAGGAIGAGIGAWIGDHGICGNDRDLIVRVDKAVSWLPYDPTMNAHQTYRCA
ncbi:hypothetical protein MHJ96_03580 [Corynebacterium aurimucosum]|nr:hypothetical protein [Corynebacterium aurimucosum]